MKAPLIAFLLLPLSLAVSPASPRVENLPDSFYNRPGLAKMPRIDYAAMKLVNVRDFGAAGDGVQDDRPAFDKAIEALGPEGGVVFVPGGKYLFPQPALPERKAWMPSSTAKPLNNVHIVGEGDDSVIYFPHVPPPLSQKTLFYGWSLPGLSNSSIRDLRFLVEPVFDQRWEPGVGINPLSSAGAKNVQFLRVRIDQGRMGIVFWVGNKDVWVVGCEVRNTGADGIHFENSTHVVAAYNLVENSGDDGIAMIGIDRQGAIRIPTKDTQFLYNTVKGVRWGRGIVISGEDAVVEGNWIEGATFAGVYVQSRGAGDPGPPIVNAIVRNNTITRNALSIRSDNNLEGHEIVGGVHVGLHVVSVLIEGNHIFANQGEGIQLGGVEELRSEKITIKNNLIESNTGPGIGVKLRTPSGTKKDSKWVSGGFPPDSAIDRLEIIDNTFAGNRGPAVAISNGASIASLIPADAVRLPQTAGGVADPYAAVRSASDDSGWDLFATAPATEGLPRANVRDFGAVGDGRADDYEPFARAFASLPPEGGVLRIPAGTYRITPRADAGSSPETSMRHHLQLSGKRNVHLVGEGSSSVLLFTAADCQGLRFLACENVSLQSLALRQENPPASRRNRALLDLAASSDVWLQSLDFSDSSGPGILLDNSRRVTIDTCRVRSAGTDGIAILGSRQILVRDSVFENTRDQAVRVSWAGGGVNRSPQFVRISRNTIAGTFSGSGIAVSSGNEIDVLENTISSTALSGISVYEQARVFGPQKIRIEGNTLDHCPDRRLAAYTRGAISVWNLKSNPVRGDLTIVGNRFGNDVPTPLWVSLLTSKMNSLRVEGNATTSGAPVEPLLDPVENKGNIKSLSLAVSADAASARDGSSQNAR